MNPVLIQSYTVNPWFQLQFETKSDRVKQTYLAEKTGITPWLKISYRKLMLPNNQTNGQRHQRRSERFKEQ